MSNKSKSLHLHCIDFTDLVHNIYIWCGVGTHGIGSTLTELGPSDVSFDFNLIWQQWQSLHNSFRSRTIWRTLGQGTRPRKGQIKLTDSPELSSSIKKLSSNGINSIWSCQIFSHNLSWLSFFPALYVFTPSVSQRLRGLTGEGSSGGRGEREQRLRRRGIIGDTERDFHQPELFNQIVHRTVSSNAQHQAGHLIFGAVFCLLLFVEFIRH